MLVYVHSLQVRGHETNSRTLAKTGRRWVATLVLTTRQLLLSGALETTLKGGLLH